MGQQLRLRVLLPIAVLALLGLGVGALAFTGTPTEEPAPAPLPPAAPAQGESRENEPSSEEQAKEQAEASRAAERLARREWRKAANDICAELNDSAAALGEPQSTEELLTVLPQSLSLSEAALARLQALEPAAADAQRVETMLAEFGAFMRIEREALEALTNQNVSLFLNLNARAFNHNDRGSTIAHRLGVSACAAGSTADSALQRELKRHKVVVAVLYAPDAMLDSLLVREARAGAALVRAGFVGITASDTRSAALLAKNYDVRAAPAVLVFVRWRGAMTTFTDFVDRETIAQAAETAGL